MREIRPVALDELDFTPFGRWYDLRTPSGAPGWEDGTALERDYRYGMTRTGGGSFSCRSMERHRSTEEVLFTSEGAMVLALAASDPMGAPRAEDVIAVRVEPGQVVVLARGVWHDACRCAEERSICYSFLANNNGEASELRWIEVVPDPVWISCGKPAAFVPEREAPAEGWSGRFCSRHDVRRDDRVDSLSWECWQTGVCLSQRMRLVFGTLPPGEEARFCSAREGQDVVTGLSAQAVLTLWQGKERERVSLRPGQMLTVAPETDWTISFPDGGTYWVMTRQRTE